MQGKPVGERLKLLRELKVCFGCLKQGNHISKECNKRLTCKTCNKSHPTILHQAQRNQPAQHELSGQQQQPAQQNHGDNRNNKAPVCSLTGAGVKVAYPSIIPVVVHSKKTGNAVETYAF